jgi:hypothetical protein
MQRARSSYLPARRDDTVNEVKGAGTFQIFQSGAEGTKRFRQTAMEEFTKGYWRQAMQNGHVESFNGRLRNWQIALGSCHS